LVRVDLTPDSATIYVGERVQLTVTGHYSDNTTRVLTDCQLTPDGGTVSEGRFSADREGRYTVTANCPDGLSDRSVFTVQPFPMITLRAMFRFDLTNVGDSLRADIDTLRWLARTMAERPGLQLTIYGHADFRGTDEYNCNLGWWRIEAVVDSLRSYGASSDALAAMRQFSFGERQPANPRRSDRARAENRRVEVMDTPTAERAARYDMSQACGPKNRDRERRP
jgi:outer membrane protein OmpA-like peptidoglycan-associated protein